MPSFSVPSQTAIYAARRLRNKGHSQQTTAPFPGSANRSSMTALSDTSLSLLSHASAGSQGTRRHQANVGRIRGS